MSTATIPELIINSPYDEPREHWKYDPQTRTFSREPGRRPAGYVRARPESHSFQTEPVAHRCEHFRCLCSSRYSIPQIIS